jgi:DNA replication licensing factor MCM4
VFNLDNVRPIRDLDPVDIDTLVAVRGMVTRAGNIIPDLRCGTRQQTIIVHSCAL